MHFPAVRSDHMLTWARPRRNATKVRFAEPQPPAAWGTWRRAWRNWWDMSVVEDVPFAVRQTRVIGARGRMVPPQ
jgi:hypothetical protein